MLKFQEANISVLIVIFLLKNEYYYKQQSNNAVTTILKKATKGIEDIIDKRSIKYAK